MVLDEAAAAGDPPHQPGGTEGRDQEDVDNLQYLKDLVDSMPDRLQEVIARDGHVTHYYNIHVQYMSTYVFFKNMKKLSFFVVLLNFSDGPA